MSSRIGPIIIIEDDPDDRDILNEVFRDLEVKNELRFFNTCLDALSYLKTTTDKPFLVFSDINMPGMSGPELKKVINADTYLRRKSIPYIFLTTSSAHQAVMDAYESLAQGYFVKPNDLRSLRQMMEMILSYWKICRHPNPAES